MLFLSVHFIVYHIVSVIKGLFFFFLYLSNNVLRLRLSWFLAGYICEVMAMFQTRTLLFLLFRHFFFPDVHSDIKFFFFSLKI